MKLRLKGRQWMVALIAMIFILSQTALADLPVGGRRTAGGEKAKSWDLVQKGTILSITAEGDEEQQAVMDLICDALSVVTSQSGPEAMPGYLTYGLYLADESLAWLNVAYDENALYLSSPIFGEKPVKLDFLAFESFATSLEEYVVSLEESGELPDLGESYMDLSFEGMDMEQFQAFWEKAQEDWDLEPIYQAFGEWFAQAWVGEPYDGEIASVYGVDIASALIYDINKAEIVKLIETVVPLLMEQDALFTDVAQFILSQEGYEPTEQELKDMVLQWKATLASFPYIVAMNIPEDFAISYNECYDASGAVAVGEIEFYLENEVEPVTLYAEWLTEEPRLYIYMSNGESSYGIEGWCVIDAPSEEAFTADMGLDFSSYWQEELEQSFNCSIQMGTLYNELGQPDMDWTFHFAYKDEYETADFVYSLAGTTAVDQDNPGSIQGYMTATEGEDTVFDVQFLLDSSVESAKGLPFDLNAEMYDVFNGTPETFVQWLTVSIPENATALEAQIEAIAQAYLEPLLADGQE